MRNRLLFLGLVFCLITSPAFAQSSSRPSTVNASTGQLVNNGSLTTPINFGSGGCLYTWTNSQPDIGLPANGNGDIPAFTAQNPGIAPLTATITATPIASGFGYIPNMLSNTVSVIATATNSVIKTIPVGESPFFVAISPDGSKVYVSNLSSSSISVIATASNSVVATISTGDVPRGLIVSHDGSKLYASNYTNHSIVVINTATNTVTNTLSTTGHQLWGIAISNDDKTLYAVDGDLNKVLAINTISGAIITINVGTNPLAALLSPDRSRLYISDQGQGISVINTVTNTLITTAAFTGSPTGLAISADGSKLYNADPTMSIVRVINTSDFSLIKSIPIATHPQGISISADGNTIYATDRGNSVFAINASTYTVDHQITIGSYPVAIGNFMTPLSVCNGSPQTFNITVNPTSPTITTSGSPGPQNTVYGTASPSSSFTVSGSDLTAGITVTPPTGFEVSKDNITFGNTAIIGNAGFTGSATVYIRLAKTTNAGTYNGDIVLSSTGAANVNLNMPNSTVSPAVINITGTYNKEYGDILTDYTLDINTPGVTFNPAGLRNGNTFKSMKISFGAGAAAADAVGVYRASVVTSNFEGDNGYLASNYIINYLPIDLEVEHATITIKAGNANKAYGATLTVDHASTNFTVTGLKNNETIGTVDLTYSAGGNAAAAPSIYSGSIYPSNPLGGTFNAANYIIVYAPGDLTVLAAPVATISITRQPSALQTVYGTPSPNTSFGVIGADLTAEVVITPPSEYEISTDGVAFSDTRTLTAATVALTSTIYLRLKPTAAAGTYTDNLYVTSAGAQAVTVPLNGTVTPAPLNISIPDIHKKYGSVFTPVAITDFTATGLQNNESIQQVNVTYTNASAQATAPVATYTNARLPVGATGTGFNTQNYNITYVPANAFVDAVPLTITAENKSKTFGAVNPPLTLTYSGFVNNENAADLTTLPLISTTADVNSPAGSYPITVSGAQALNYTIMYVPGILTVVLPPSTAAKINVPNTFTPNADGMNDFWKIDDLKSFPNCDVEIYDRNGQHLYHSVGYSQPWDGTANSRELPFGTYYYTIQLNDGITPKLSGFIAIVK